MSNLTKINKLTKKQINSTDVYVNKWITLVTQPQWNPDKAKSSIPGIYGAANLKPPKYVYIINDPIEIIKIIRQHSKDKTKSLKEYYLAPHDGIAWCEWKAFYNFFDDHFQLAEKLRPYFSLSESGAFWYWFYSNLCVLLSPPKLFFEPRIKESKNPYRLHCENGPAVKWTTTELYFLHGIPVEKWLVMTPAEEIDPQQFSKIKNVDVRREFVRKIGVERLMQKLGSKLLDKESDYELHEIDLGEKVGKWPYLKMLNPSLGIWHVECVDQTCRTVAMALEFRNGTKKRPLYLT